VQFESLLDVFRLMLREEIRQQRRYSHVIRMRTDAIWSATWSPYPALRSLVPPTSEKLAAVPTSGPLFDDHFWIASRAVAWRAFVDAPYHMKQPVDRKHMYEVFGCNWSSLSQVHARAGTQQYDPLRSIPEDELLDDEYGRVYGKIFSDRMFQEPEDACYFTIVGAVLGHSTWADTTLKYLLTLWGVDFVDCCGVTGEFIHSGSHEMFLRACVAGAASAGHTGLAAHRAHLLRLYAQVEQLSAAERAVRPLAKGGDPVRG
jgi:hypothetical protein